MNPWSTDASFSDERFPNEKVSVYYMIAPIKNFIALVVLLINVYKGWLTESDHRPGFSSYIDTSKNNNISSKLSFYWWGFFLL